MAVAPARRRRVLPALALSLALAVVSASSSSSSSSLCAMPAATLTTDCLGQCDAHVPCLVSAGDCAVQCFPDAYTSWGFEFLVPFGSYRSAAEVAERAKQSDDAFDARVAALPNDTAGHAAAGNDALSLLGTLAVPANLTGMAVYGGPSTTGYVRGKVAGVRLAESSTFVADASEMTLLSLENLELGPQLADVFADKLPTGLTDLYLRNNALESFALSAPEEQLPKLRTLSLAENYLTAFDAALPSLEVLYLTNNSLSAIPPSVFAMPKLFALYISGNTLTNATVSQSQFEFLAGLDTLELTASDFASAATADCAADALKTLRGLQFCVLELSAGSASSASSSSSSASSSSASASSASSGSSSSVTIGVSVAAVVLVLGAVGAFVWLQRRKRSGAAKAASSSGDNNSTATTARTMATGSSGRSHDANSSNAHVSLWTDAELLAVQVQLEDIEDVRALGSGAFGSVWLVKFRGTQLLASKRLLQPPGAAAPGGDEDEQRRVADFVAEIKLNARLEHRGVVAFRGAAWHFKRDLQALFEFMDGGDLLGYLDVTRPAVQAGIGIGNSSSGDCGSWTPEKLQMAVDVADALVYVHSFAPPIIHRDLKSRNILLSSSSSGLVAKVSDFGASRYKSLRETMTAGVGTGRWVAPEVLAGAPDYDERADVYSLGVVLGELDTHALPFRDFGRPPLPLVAVLQLVVAGSARPTLRADCPPPLRALISSCLAHSASERPAAAEVAYALRSARRELGW